MKRFTETKKWSDPWFRKLDPKFKVLWLYLVDSCDVAGIWDADLELAQFQTGVRFEIEDVMDQFAGRIVILQSGKWFLTKFIEFQHGSLNPENPCHKGVLRILQIHAIEAPLKPLQRAFKGPQVKVKVKVKDKREGECEGKPCPEPLNVPEFLTIWKRWERHRTEIRKPLHPETIDASLKKLSTYGVDRAIEIIEYTLAKGWQGLADELNVPQLAKSKLKPIPDPIMELE